jgi:hypothetical protein
VTAEPQTPGHDKPGPDLEGCEKNHCHGRRRDGTGKACHRPAGWGTDHVGTGSCKLHGGATPNHRTAARIEQAKKATATYGLPIDVGPAEALLQELRRTAGHVAWLERRVAELDEDELVWGVVEETVRGVAEETDRPTTPNGGGLETKRKAGTNALIKLYQEERKHLAQVSKAAIDAGVSERVVQIYEQIAASYVQVLERVIDRLNLTPQQRDLVPQLIERELRALTTGGTD